MKTNGQIFITGDTHGDIDFMKLRILAQKNKGLTPNDYVVIAGDFGGVWSKGTLNKDLYKYVSLPFTVLFIDGNHENFDLLNSMPIEEWNGGKVHRVADSILHLMRGQVYTIYGKTFFTFGGAESIDKECRREGISWWAAEVPNYADYDEAYKNLSAVENKVDYIVTHTIDEKTLCLPPFLQYGFEAFGTNRGLSNFENEVEYDHWYFGHYHFDAEITDKKTALYNKVVCINKNK